MNTRCFLLSLLGLASLVVASRSSSAGDPGDARLVAQLIWGTNENKPTNQDLKPIDSDVEKRLRRIFKWERYFGIERKKFAVAAGKGTRVDMSKDCRIEVAQVPGGEFEIQLFGKGQLVVKKRQRITPGEAVVLGGDDKNDNAWFVVVSLAKAGDGKE